ncbi:MAG: hypothetical protein ACOCY1_04105 [Halovenus sp.]
MTESNDGSPSPSQEPSSSDRNGELSYDQRTAAATEAVRQLTSYFQTREQ